MKKIIFCLALVAITYLNAQPIEAVVAETTAAPENKFSKITVETTPSASMPLGIALWDFEFKNKSYDDVYLTIENSGRKILDNFKVAKPAMRWDLGNEEVVPLVRTTSLDLFKPTLITFKYRNIIRNYETKGNGKTIYVTWEDNELRPQLGKGILTKKTQSGLPLKNNIKAQELKRFQKNR